MINTSQTIQIKEWLSTHPKDIPSWDHHKQSLTTGSNQDLPKDDIYSVLFEFLLDPVSNLDVSTQKAH